MTIEEAIEHLITVKGYYTSDRDFTPQGEDYEPLLAEEKQAIDKAVETLKKQIPKKPLGGFDFANNEYKICCECSAIVKDGEWEAQYCPDCGQALDWSDNE